MPMKPEAAQWADGLLKAGVSADQLKSITDAIEGNDAAQDYVSDGQRRMNSLKADMDRKAAEIESQQQELTASTARLASWKAAADNSLTEKSRRIETLESDITRARQRIDYLKEAYAIDEQDLADLFTDTSPRPAPGSGTGPSPSPGSTPPYLTEERFSKEIAAMAQTYPFLSAEFLDLHDDHRELFGKRLDVKPLIQRSLETGRSVRDLWSSEYKVPERRAELAAKEKSEWEKRIREEERQKVVSELSISGVGPATAGTARRGSPVFELKKPAPAPASSNPSEPVFAHPATRPHDTVLRAVRAYRERSSGGGEAA